MNANGHPEVAALRTLKDSEGTALSGREFLSRTDLRDIGLPRRAIDSCFGNAPVIVLPGYSRPLIRRADFEAFLLEHTYDETRVRP